MLEPATISAVTNVVKQLRTDSAYDANGNLTDQSAVATFLGQPVYMRINDFPDENLYSVWLGDGWLDFDDLPASWSVEFPINGWPVGARPALPKGQFLVV